jgi:hypothetical protein
MTGQNNTYKLFVRNIRVKGQIGRTGKKYEGVIKVDIKGDRFFGDRF